MKRPKSPQLKVPDVKVPRVLSDLYWDLRDRRLLPLVGLLLVAIVAAPILLNGGKSPEPPRVAPMGSGAKQSASLAVLPAEPGLREPSKRLAGHSSKDPFKQHYTAPLLEPGAKPVSGSKLATTTTTTTTPGENQTTGGESSTTVETSSSGSSESAPSSTPSEPPSKSSTGNPARGTPEEDSGGSEGSAGDGESPGSRRGNNGDAVPPGGLTYYTFAINVQITQARTKPDGSTEVSEPTVRKEVEPPQALPGEKAPAITYIGASAKTRNPLFLISTEVTAVFGEGKCVAGTSACQLIELEPGFPVTFVYGENHVRYKVNVIKTVPVITGHS